MSEYVVVLEHETGAPLIYGPYTLTKAERVREALVRENHVQRPLPYVSVEALVRYHGPLSEDTR